MQTRTFRKLKTGANTNQSFEVGVNVQRYKPNQQVTPAMVTIEVPMQHEILLQTLAENTPGAKHGNVIRHSESQTSAIEFEFNLRKLPTFEKPEQWFSTTHLRKEEISDIAAAVFKLIEQVPGYEKGRAFKDHTDLNTFDKYENWGEFVDTSKPSMNGHRTYR